MFSVNLRFRTFPLTKFMSKVNKNYCCKVGTNIRESCSMCVKKCNNVLIYLKDSTSITKNRNAIFNTEYEKGLKDIHKNKVSPNIAGMESQLSRSTRSILSQLWSGKCKLLNSYQKMIDNSLKKTCPLC